MDDLAKILAREAQAISAAGVSILQIDDPALTYFCDRRLMAGEFTHDERLRRKWSVDEEFPAAVAAINRVVEGLDTEIHLHCCHSVYKRRSDVTGDYKPFLPRVNQINVDRVNLEFAYTGTGDITDLHYLPPHLGVGLGVVDVRCEEIQSVDEIEAIAAGAAHLVSPERIALNPDCGFAPSAGEPPSIDEAFEKLRRLAEAADRLRQRSIRGEFTQHPGL
jgi:5-methyltetrahydropteroyltriglutamate--homocysteine methyltransferase